MMEIKEQQVRFRDAIWFPKKEESILVGGAGGIGTWVTFLLARVGYSPIVYDNDIVEKTNLGGQLYRRTDIGRYKTSAIADIVEEYCDDEISTFNIKVNENTPPHHFMISAFDNMKARKDFFNIWKKNIKNCTVAPLLIDGRLEAEELHILCVTPDNMKKYEQGYLFDDSLVEDAPCTMRQTSHSAMMIASHIVGFFTNHMTNIYERKKIREVPFEYKYFIPLNLTS